MTGSAGAILASPKTLKGDPVATFGATVAGSDPELAMEPVADVLRRYGIAHEVPAGIRIAGAAIGHHGAYKALSEEVIAGDRPTRSP